MPGKRHANGPTVVKDRDVVEPGEELKREGPRLSPGAGRWSLRQPEYAATGAAGSDHGRIMVWYCIFRVMITSAARRKTAVGWKNELSQWQCGAPDSSWETIPPMVSIPEQNRDRHGTLPGNGSSGSHDDTNTKSNAPVRAHGLNDPP
ncbi:hypothetical protein VTN96DRAFT_4502 [Rasamsonia emersonii]